MDKYKVTTQFYGHVPFATSGGAIGQRTRLTIMIGEYGPFSRDFEPGEDSTEALNAWIQQQVQNVRTITGV